LKKAGSIILLLVFLFNVGGYYFVFLGLLHTSDQALTHRLNEGLYSPEETIELKIPVSLPYPIQQEDFKRIDGTFEHEGVFYKMVKRKVENGTVYIVCIRDHQQKRIVKTIADYVKMTNELPSSSKNSTHFVGKFLKDYESGISTGIHRQAGWTLDIAGTQQSFELLPAEIRISSPPPKG
jgi:hypothetical protein